VERIRSAHRRDRTVTLGYGRRVEHRFQDIEKIGEMMRSSCYSQIVGAVAMPNVGDELHHVGRKEFPMRWIALIAFFCSVGPVTALAQDIPDMTGTWQSEPTHAVVLGSGAHYVDDDGGTQPRAASAILTLTIDHQEGRRFWGRIASETQEEPWLAVFDHTGEGYIGVDSDGYLRGTMIDPDSFENCYTQITPIEVASCSIFHRQ
jgi:hypothetical protein